MPRDGATTGNVTIADCFITWKEKLLVYGEFCSNLPRAQGLLDQLCEAKPIVSERVTVCTLIFPFPVSYQHPGPGIEVWMAGIDTWTVSKQAEGSTFLLGLRDMTLRVRDCLGC